MQMQGQPDLDWLDSCLGLVLGLDCTEVTTTRALDSIRGGYVPRPAFCHSFSPGSGQGYLLLVLTLTLALPPRFLAALSAVCPPRPSHLVRVGRCDAICMNWSMVPPDRDNRLSI